jgi:hypothetical protein
LSHDRPRIASSGCSKAVPGEGGDSGCNNGNDGDTNDNVIINDTVNITIIATVAAAISTTSTNGNSSHFYTCHYALLCNLTRSELRYLLQPRDPKAQ